jgi:DNA-directed RNA polymerase subunit M/transcription elongation factor TFIIS
MSAVGSLVFCTDCGNLLDSSTGNKNTVLVCDCCGAENKGEHHLTPLREILIKHRYCLEDDHYYHEGVFLSVASETKTVFYSDCGKK